MLKLSAKSGRLGVSRSPTGFGPISVPADPSEHSEQTHRYDCAERRRRGGRAVHGAKLPSWASAGPRLHRGQRCPWPTAAARVEGACPRGHTGPDKRIKAAGAALIKSALGTRTETLVSASDSSKWFHLDGCPPHQLWAGIQAESRLVFYILTHQEEVSGERRIIGLQFRSKKYSGMKMTASPNETQSMHWLIKNKTKQPPKQKLNKPTEN